MHSGLIRLACCGAAALLLGAAAPVAKASPQSVTPSYQYTEERDARVAPALYTVDRVRQLSELPLEACGTVSDLFVEEDGTVDLLDSENGTLIQLDAQFHFQRVLTFTEEGADCRFPQAGGMFVRGTGEAKTYYIADGERQCILVADAGGRVRQRLTRPVSNLIPDTLVFAPQKVVVNDSGVVYAIVPHLYMGAVTFSADGEFLGFYGSNRVEVSAKLLLDHFWKKLLNSEQKTKLAKYVPVEYANLDIDSENFVYTVTSVNAGSGNDTEQIKRINAKGVNLLESQEYGDLEYAYDNGVLVDTSFVDVAVTSEGIIAALDATRGRVFVYDEQGHALGVFGGMGEYRGSFRLPIALDSWGRELYVFDQAKQAVTAFRPTDFGDRLLSAVQYTRKGQFEKAYQKWQEVIERDAGCEMAYVGIGKMRLQEKRYREAAEAFRLGNDRAAYSQAFGQYRNSLMTTYYWLVFLLLLALIAAVFIGGHRAKHRRRDAYALKSRGTFAKVRYALFHPIDGIGAMTGTVSAARQFAIAGVIAAAWLLISVICYHSIGFAFNTHDENAFNIWGQLAQTVGLLLVFVIANWFVCVMTSGSGKLSEIALTTSLALIPYLLFQLIELLLSNLLTVEESGFVWVIGAVFLIWAVALLLLGLQTIHEFTFSRNVFTVLATLIGMLVMAFMAILVWSLLQQVVSFVVSVTDEMTLLLR